MSAGAQSRCLSLSMKRSLSDKAASTDRVLARVIAWQALSSWLGVHAGTDSCPRISHCSKQDQLQDLSLASRFLGPYLSGEASQVPKRIHCQVLVWCQLRPAVLAQLHGESAAGTVAPERLSALWPMGFPLGFCMAMDFMASLMGSWFRGISWNPYVCLSLSLSMQK